MLIVLKIRFLKIILSNFRTFLPFKCYLADTQQHLFYAWESRFCADKQLNIDNLNNKLQVMTTLMNGLSQKITNNKKRINTLPILVMGNYQN